MTIEERLEKLERQLGRAKRRNYWLLVGLAVCVGLGGVAWAFRPEPARAQPALNAVKEIRANRFILEDKQGKTRAQLTVYSDGPRLSLFDQQGKVGAELAGTEGGARQTTGTATFESKSTDKPLRDTTKMAVTFHMSGAPTFDTQ